MRTTTKLLTVVACVLGWTCGPALAAPFTVSSASMSTFKTCTLTPLSVLSDVGTDATVDENSAKKNFGTETTVTARSQTARHTRVYVRFDLARCSPAIPASATIDSSLLRSVPSTVANACRTYDVFRVTSAWTETGITWNNQPFGTAINNPPTPSRTASTDIGSAPCANSVANIRISGWDVTSDVRAFHAGTANHGWMIRDDTEGSAQPRTTTFYARELGSVTAAQLIVNYTA